MAKKRFTDNLESLFGDSAEKKTPSLFPDEQITVEVRTQADRSDQKGNKRFAQKLDAFLAESFEEANADSDDDEGKPTPQPTQRPRLGRRRGSGLDILIRNTTTTAPTHEEIPEPNTKRLTVVIDKEQLQQLKEIARKENRYLKDIIGDLVDEYIQQQ